MYKRVHIEYAVTMLLAIPVIAVASDVFTARGHWLLWFVTAAFHVCAAALLSRSTKRYIDVLRPDNGARP